MQPFDIRHQGQNPAFCEPHPDRTVTIRLHTEPGFAEANVIYNDGSVHAAPMQVWGETERFQFWEVVIHPTREQFHYGFALKYANDTTVYFGPSGVTFGLEFYFHVDLTQLAFTTPDWAKGAVIYQIFPERFANGDSALNPPGTVPWGTPPEGVQVQGGDLRGIIQHLDYLQDLGVDVLYLNPIFTSPSNHKYDTSDYYHVDPAFGGNEAFRDLMSAAHARDMRVIIDASFNHCHPTFFAFKDIQENGRDSAYWDWFTIYRYPLDVKLRPHISPYEMDEKQAAYYRRYIQDFADQTGIPVLTLEDDDGPPLDPAYNAWFNVLTMPKINLNNPATRQYFLDVAAYWVREFGIDGWRMDVVAHITDDFWLDFRRVVKETNPDAYLLAELWGDSSFWLQGDRFDATMDYTFRQFCLEFFAESKIDAPAFVNGLKHLRMMYGSEVTAANQHLLSSHDTARFLHFAKEEIHRLRLAYFFALTFPGAPGIYYGDEIGMTGGHDPDCRRAFPWEKRDTWDTPTWEMIQSLIQLRHQSPALRVGDWQPVWGEGEALALLRTHRDEKMLVVLTRETPLTALSIPLDASSVKLAWGTVEWSPTETGLRIDSLAAWSGAIFKL